LKLASPKQKMNSDAEHDLIVAACLRGDVNGAAALLETHLLQSGELVASYIQGSPERRAVLLPPGGSKHH